MLWRSRICFMSTDTLSVFERAKLENYECIIEDGLQTCFDVGRALLAIRDEKLYRITHKTFEEYCQEKWNLSRPHAYRMIESAEVIQNVSQGRQSEPLPANERQARPLAKLQPAEQADAWQEAVEESDGKPTAKDVEAVVNKRLGKTKAVSLYVCPDCGEQFKDEVWHCEKCAHHWPIELNECSNCYRTTTTEKSKPKFDTVAEAEKLMATVRRAIERWPERLRHEAIHWVKEVIKECE